MSQSPSLGGRAERLRARRRTRRRRTFVVIGVALAAAFIVGALLFTRGSNDGATDSASTKRRVATTATSSPTTTTLTTPPTTEPSTTSTSSVTTIPPAAAISRAELRPGTRGSDVVALQERLIALGYNPGPPDGDFSSATTAAVIAFQRTKGLPADGVVGAQTWAALNAGQ